MPVCKGQYYVEYDGGAGVSGHPTILLHGLGGSHLSWPPDFRRLPGEHVYALDLPGHGLSTLPACTHISQHVDYLHQFVVNMGFPAINLIGHSMGSAIAYSYTVKHPERIGRLSLLSFGTRFLYADQLARCFSEDKTIHRALELLYDKGFHSIRWERMRKKLIAPLEKTNRDVLYADASMCAAFSAPPPVHPIQFPMQIIIGGQDGLIAVDEVRLFASKMAHTTLHVIENCGHMLVYEQPEIARKHLMAFLHEI